MMPGITQSIPVSFKLDSLLAVHNFAVDIFKLALFDSTIATLDETTSAYTPIGEIAGAGYAAGGLPMTVSSGWPAIYLTSYAGCRFDDAIWPGATFFADGALLYNASKGNRAVRVLAFPSRQLPVAGTFRVKLPLTLDPLVNFK